MILLVNKLIEAAVIHVFVRLLSALVFYSFVIKKKRSTSSSVLLGFGHQPLAYGCVGAKVLVGQWWFVALHPCTIRFFLRSCAAHIL
jgi:hypothetical protein